MLEFKPCDEVLITLDHIKVAERQLAISVGLLRALVSDLVCAVKTDLLDEPSELPSRRLSQDLEAPIEVASEHFWEGDALRDVFLDRDSESTLEEAFEELV